MSRTRRTAQLCLSTLVAMLAACPSEEDDDEDTGAAETGAEETGAAETGAPETSPAETSPAEAGGDESTSDVATTQSSTEVTTDDLGDCIELGQTGCGASFCCGGYACDMNTPDGLCCNGFGECLDDAECCPGTQCLPNLDGSPGMFCHSP